ncbi:MAG: hypothetical protein GY805_01805 [Chloroflexi bacterium]|nr:hypothetical protein [Chloroflexota bacterium]
MTIVAGSHQLKLSYGGNSRFQCRFAKAGRGGDKGEFAALLQPLVELFDEMGAGDEKRP